MNELERILHGLHVHEFMNWDGAMVEILSGSPAWADYLEARYRLDVNGEPRAFVVAELLAGALKRAPQTMARHYRRAATARLARFAFKF